LKEANYTVNRQERLDRLRIAERYAMDAMPLIPLYVYSRKFLIKPYVHGWHANTRGIYPLKHFWLKGTRAVREPPLQEKPQ
jgi:ABC-type oligopeptide transport system substrate-binding subunit